MRLLFVCCYYDCFVGVVWYLEKKEGQNGKEIMKEDCCCCVVVVVVVVVAAAVAVVVVVVIVH